MTPSLQRLIYDIEEMSEHETWTLIYKNGGWMVTVEDVERPDGGLGLVFEGEQLDDVLDRAMAKVMEMRREEGE